MGEMVAVGTARPGLGPRDHVVQFYADERELVEQVAPYLSSAVEGGVAIVIASPEHRHAFARQLAEAGVDVSGARERGDYVDVDARQTAGQFTAGDRVDNEGFERVIGGIIRKSVESGRFVRAYGEMVALLWDDGLVNAAIDLEAMWNELRSQYPFSLFCAYPAHSVAGDDKSDAFDEVCLLHGGIVGTVPAPLASQPATESKAFSLNPDAPAAARHFAFVAMPRLGRGHMVDDVALVVTELAANAVLHAHSEFSVTLSASADFVRISVRDTCPLPEGRSLSAKPTHGLGLVASLARDWGVVSLDDSKVVWAQLPA
jgi:hypothetical protein